MCICEPKEITQLIQRSFEIEKNEEKKWSFQMHGGRMCEC